KQPSERQVMGVVVRLEQDRLFEVLPRLGKAPLCEQHRPERVVRKRALRLQRERFAGLERRRVQAFLAQEHQREQRVRLGRLGIGPEGLFQRLRGASGVAVAEPLASQAELPSVDGVLHNRTNLQNSFGSASKTRERSSMPAITIKKPCRVSPSKY